MNGVLSRAEVIAACTDFLFIFDLMQEAAPYSSVSILTTSEMAFLGGSSSVIRLVPFLSKLEKNFKDILIPFNLLKSVKSSD